MSATVRLCVEGSVAVVTLDAPPLNIYDLAMRDGLIEALAAVRDLPEIRALVLRANGPHFSAGADLREFGSAGSTLEARRIRWDRDPWGLLWELPVLTVVSLHGSALGSGLELSLLCDLRIASPDVRLGLPETKLGMLPAAGGTQSLSRAIGPHASAPLVLGGATLDASEAMRRGLVHRIVPDPDSEARRLAERVTAAPPGVVRAARRALHAAGDLPLDEGLRAERRLAVALVASLHALRRQPLPDP